MPRYQPNFTKASLLLPESRIIADLLLKEVTNAQWDQAILEDNILQKRTRHTASSYAGLIRKRLETMQPELWQLVRDGSLPLATLAMFSATLKYSILLGDFLWHILQEKRKRFDTSLHRQNWDRYIEDCRNRDPAMSAWTDATHTKLRQNAFRMLVEAGYLTDTRSLTLRNVPIPRELICCLKNQREDRVLRCLQVSE